ncbi:uncharacterized protein LOC132931914 [Rhopalosiphum padi]|uniref:uncharacterized protein LOC132931914 n=1 Tax=Rhopalosiphum padi TaxID=40932 RepID=UPI00298D7EEE|nr:uncharacterized protein LOC132931914 [Rhopalosiphum padi]
MYFSHFFNIVLLSSMLSVIFIPNIGGSEDGKKSKSPRALETRNAGGDDDADSLNQRDNLEDDDEETTKVPPGFLSPSVREYLELGRSIPGKPGTDYPVLAVVPYTDFYCDDQPYPGFFADVDTRCQAWHYCDIDGRQASFLCPNGTQFSQAVFVCDWWFNVRCDLSKELYHINERLYRTTPRPDRPHRVLTKELLDQIFL